MLGLACQYDERQHKVIHPPLENWVKGQVSDPVLRDRLFIYYHNLEGTFVIGLWEGNSKGYFIDAMNLGDSLQNFDRLMAQSLVTNLSRPLSNKQIARGFRRSERDELHAKQEYADEYSSKFRHGRSTKESVSLAGM